MHQYQRAPIAQEWPDLLVPPQAVVTVHLINAHCTVRVLGLPHGPRLAEVLDTDPTRAAPPVPPAPPVAPPAWRVGQAARVAFVYAGQRRSLQCHIRTVHPTRIEVELRGMVRRFWVAPKDLHPDLVASVELAG